jgi:hypothetical protein
VLLVYIWNTEIPEVQSLEEIPDRFTKMLLPPEDPPEVEPLETDEVDESLKSEAKEEKKVEKKVEKKAKPKNKVDAAKQREAMKQDVVQKSLLLKMLTTRGESSGGFAEDLWTDDKGLGDLDAAIKGAGGVEIASAENQMRQGQGGDTKDADIGDLAGVGGGDAALGSGPETKIEGSTELGQGEGDFEEGDIGSVKRVVQRNFGQLTYCYEQRLKQNPRLSGRVEIEGYGNNGRVSSAKVFANTSGDSELGACIVKKIKRWSFPPEIEGEIIYPFIFKPKG